MIKLLKLKWPGVFTGHRRKDEVMMNWRFRQPRLGNKVAKAFGGKLFHGEVVKYLQADEDAGVQSAQVFRFFLCSCLLLLLMILLIALFIYFSASPFFFLNTFSAWATRVLFFRLLLFLFPLLASFLNDSLCLRRALVYMVCCVARRARPLCRRRRRGVVAGGVQRRRRRRLGPRRAERSHGRGAAPPQEEVRVSVSACVNRRPGVGLCGTMQKKGRYRGHAKKSK